MPCTASRKARALLLRNWAAIISSGSKATKVASSIKPNACWPGRVFPPQGQWEKQHGRFDRRRLARVAVSPEEIGLAGCWQVIAVERYSQDQHQPQQSASLEIGYYATSLAIQQRDDTDIMAAIRGHWSAIENGTHYRRDVTFAEDACRTASRSGAAVLASLRNLANGTF